MTGKKTMGIESLWNTTEEKPVHSKEIIERHHRLIREYETALYKKGRMQRGSKSLRDEEEVSRANLRAFERLHGLTSSDPRIG